MVAPCLGGSKPVAIAASLVVATLGLSVFPTNTGVLASGTIVDEAGCAGADCGDIMMLEDFARPEHKWVEMNDPVMGGRSKGTFHVDESASVGVFHGSVEIVPFLHAPGFVKAETSRGESWPDASDCDGLQLSLKSSTPSYQGFRVSFGSKRPKGAFPYSYGFKTNLKLDPAAEAGFQTVKLPFNDFTDKWDAGTGDAEVTCAENKEFCPEAEDKANLYSIAVWGEGVEGEIDLQIQSIAAYGCSSGASGAAEAEGEAEETPIVAVFTGGGASSGAILIEDFSDPSHDWRTMNDPVMGGKSKSSVSISDGIAQFQGTCAIVPFLRAPGFITMVTGGYFAPSESFPDVSACEGLSMNIRSTVAYDGYYVSFGTDRAPGGRHASGYKTNLDLAESDDFAEVYLPFSKFSSNWDEGTGKTKVKCKDDSRYCPSLDNLRDMKTISFWGEGVEGQIALDVMSIHAYGCNSGDELLVSRAEWGTAALLSRSFSGFGLGWVGAGAAVALGVIVAKIRNRSQRLMEYQEIDMVGASLA